ncbi:MAG: MFS transporter [Acidimicrobiales bacterium]
MTDAAERPASAWAPLRIHIFRWLWLASTVSNVGTFMHNVGAAWLMTDLTRSPTLISLLQTVYAAPGFLLALPAGALADVVDRRRMLLISQSFMLAVAAVLGVLTLTDRTTTTWLLVLTFLLSVGGTVNMPAWTSLTPELVPPDQLPQAVALNSISMNLAQSVGPAIAGVIIAASGSGAVFLINAASFVAVVTVIATWRRDAPEAGLPAEHVASAIRTGLRYTRHSPSLLVLLGRLALFVAFSSSLTALLPLLARTRLGVTAGGFGLLEAALGVGAVAMASVLPRLRKRLGPDGVILAGSVAYGVGLVVVAHSRVLPLACTGLALVGAAAIVVMTTVFATLQGILPAWVRGRGLAVAMLTVWLVTAPASYLWGTLAQAIGVTPALSVAAAGVAAVAFVVARPLTIAEYAEIDITPVPLAMPTVACEPAAVDGPVLVTVEWMVDPHRADEFELAMRAVRRHRRRDGAMTWGLFHDLAVPGRMLESFTVASWAEHERQHERSVATDVAEEAAARGMVIDGGPTVTHLVAARRRVHD